MAEKEQELVDEHGPEKPANGVNPTAGGNRAVGGDDGPELGVNVLDTDAAFPVANGEDLYPAPVGRRRRRTGSQESVPATAGGLSGGAVGEFVRRIGADRLVSCLLALIAAGAIIWGISLQSRLNDSEDELDAVREELTLAQAGDDGVVRTVAYLLDPTPDGPETANAIVELQAENSPTAKLTVLGMPPTEDGRTFQLWFLNLNDSGETEGAPRPSVTFQIGPNGAVNVDAVPVDGPFDAVAITDEPAGGSPAPTTAPILYGTRGVAAG